MSVRIIQPSEETNAQYHASGAWGSSLISTFIKSPALAHLMITGAYRQSETPAMRFGTRFHSLLDPTSNFAAKHRKGPDADRRTKVWAAADAEATAAGIELIPADEWDALHAMVASVRANPIAMSLLNGAEHEVGFRMNAPQGPFQVQCRTDVIHRFSHLADLKSTMDVDDFGGSVSNYGYYRQAALYRWIVSHACGGELLPFSFIVVEKAIPYRCRVVDLNDEYLAIGSREVSSALEEIGRRTAENDWSDHRDAEVLVPPMWMMRDQSIRDVA
jgi:exodeoxyribonuclease VIII